MTTTIDSFTAPSDAPEFYYRARIGGVLTPGAIPPKGISGWDLETEYDVKKGKGADDATQTDAGDNPAVGRIKWQVWRKGVGDTGHPDPNEPNDFKDDDDFVKMLRAARRAKKALDIVHPLINQQEVKAVVVRKIGILEDEGGGLFTRECEFGKWVPEPKDAGGTPASAQDKDGNDLDADKPGAEPFAGPDGPNKQLYQEFNDKLDQAQNAGDDE